MLLESGSVDNSLGFATKMGDAYIIKLVTLIYMGRLNITVY